MRDQIIAALRAVAAGEMDKALLSFWRLLETHRALECQLQGNPPRKSLAGRRNGSGAKFRDAQDFWDTIVTDLRILISKKQNPTQKELAAFWYQSEEDPTANFDSLVSEIKRWCKKYSAPWASL